VKSKKVGIVSERKTLKSGQMFDLSVIIDSDIKEKREITPTGVSFHAIESRALALLFSESCDIDVLLQQLQALFLMNPTCRRQTRLTPRVKSSERQRLSFWQRQRKHCF